MEQRDPESGPAAGFDAAPGGPADIELATAAAIAEAEQADPAATADGARRAGAEAGTAAGDGNRPDWTTAPSPAAAGATRSPRRWIVVTAVAVTAVALATTAAAVAMRDPGHPDPVAAGVGQSQSPEGGAGQLDTAAGTTQSATDPGGTTSQSASTSSASPTASTPSPSKRSSPSATGSKPAVPVGSNETDCENTSHETPQDAAKKFSGMTKGTQQAFLDAQAAAKDAGITPFVLNSGYRSAAYQQRIFDCWVAQLGSSRAARQYALPPSQSAHVAGYAMDIAPQSAAAWLESTAGKYGLCRRYVDEPWHFEYQSTYKTKGCPALLPQP